MGNLGLFHQLVSSATPVSEAPAKRLAPARSSGERPGVSLPVAAERAASPVNLEAELLMGDPNDYFAGAGKEMQKSLMKWPKRWRSWRCWQRRWSQCKLNYSGTEQRPMSFVLNGFLCTSVFGCIAHTQTLNEAGLGGGFKHFLFSPLFGEDFQFD